MGSVTIFLPAKDGWDLISNLLPTPSPILLSSCRTQQQEGGSRWTKELVQIWKQMLKEEKKKKDIRRAKLFKFQIGIQSFTKIRINSERITACS